MSISDHSASWFMHSTKASTTGLFTGARSEEGNHRAKSDQKRGGAADPQSEQELQSYLLGLKRSSKQATLQRSNNNIDWLKLVEVGDDSDDDVSKHLDEKIADKKYKGSRPCLIQESLPIPVRAKVTSSLGTPTDAGISVTESLSMTDYSFPEEAGDSLSDFKHPINNSSDELLLNNVIINKDFGGTSVTRTLHSTSLDESATTASDLSALLIGYNTSSAESNSEYTVDFSGEEEVDKSGK